MNKEWIAHINHSEDRVQTLVNHCNEVAVLSSGFLYNLNLFSFGYLIGILHDMGKACIRFETHIKEQNADKVDHATIAAQYLYRLLMGVHVENQVLAIHLLNMVIMSHHTGLENYLNYDGSSTYLRRLNKHIETYDEATSHYIADIFDRDCILDYVKKSGVEFDAFLNHLNKRYDGMEFSKEMQLFECSLLGRLMFSSLVDADRKNSSEFDHKNLHLSIGEKRWERYYNRVLEHCLKFDTSNSVNKIRSEISEVCDEAGNRPQGIYELSVPTGGGKTIASLRFALRHAMVHENIEHIIYVIPYNTILNQNAESIQSILFGNQTYDEDEFLLHNSTVIASDEDRYRHYTERWDSRIIMTSSVQFLNALFRGKKQDARRMHQLSNSIIILDEIQCLPLKVINMFNTAMNFLHHVCHSTILLCTATQPKLHEIAKPILLSNDASLVKNYTLYYEKLKRVEIINLYREGGYTMEAFLVTVCSLLNNSPSALIVMNTKKQANDVYQALKQQLPDSTAIFHLSTSMCYAHREDCICEVINLLDNKKPVVLVSTNLIEAGVDISFPMAIRAMAGMDDIVQLAGRCNRNGELENAKGNVYILNMQNDPLHHLPELKIKKKCTEIFLQEYTKHTDLYDCDLLSLRSMEKYYAIYNNELSENHRNLIDYYVKDISDTIYRLLSSNDIGENAALEKHIPLDQLPFLFAYEEAGRRFQVIDQDTIDVIVPYKKGISIIDSITSNLTYKELSPLLKEMQNYTVSLYEQQIQQLGNRIAYVEEYGIRILSDSNYDLEKGVVFDGQCLGILI